MGVEYSAYVGYGFAVDLDSIPVPDEYKDDGVQEYLYTIDIEHATAANYWAGDRSDFKVILCVDGTLTEVSYEGENCVKIDDSNINVESVLELQVKLEKLGIEIKDDPSWYIISTVY